MGALKFIVGLVKGTGKLGAGLAVGALGTAAASEGGLGGAVKELTQFGARLGGEMGPEGSFQSFFKWIEKFGEILMSLTNGKYGQGLVDWGRDMMDSRTPEEKLAGASPLSDERTSQRVYEEGANPSDPTTRFTVNGPNGSPPSVEFSEQESTLGNTINLGFKAVKDGLGVAAGGVAGTIGWVADGIGLDALTGSGGFGWDSSLASSWYNNTAWAVNEATDFAVYDVAAQTALFLPTVAGNLWEGKSLSESFSAAWDADYEPTVRSEADLSLYNGISRTSGIVIGSLAAGYGAAAAGIGGSSLATGGSALGNAFSSSMSGLKGLSGVALAVAPVPGRKAKTTAGDPSIAPVVK